MKQITAYLCPYCQSPTTFVSAKTHYENEKMQGQILRCTRYPICNSYVGCHQRNGKPFGTLANADLRAARQGLHHLFDQRWKNKDGAYGPERQAAYTRLAGRMGIPPSLCHIGLFNLEQCHLAMALCLGDVF